MIELILLCLLFLVAGVATLEFRAGKLIKIQRASLDELKWIRYHLAFMHKGYERQMEEAAQPPPLPVEENL